MMTLRSIFYDLIDSDDYENFIKNVEKLFRTSNEYKMWLSMTDNLSCAITNLTKDSVEIEVHHYEETLWVIIEEILDYFIQNEIPFNTFCICQILVDLHFNQCITYIPLQHDIHKMLHKDPTLAYQLYPNIEENVVYGNVSLRKNIIKRWGDLIKNIK
jgi:hypothetical protein